MFTLDATFDTQTLTYRQVTVKASQFGIVNPDYDQQWKAEDFPHNKPSELFRVSRPTRNRTPYEAHSDGGSPIGIGLPATARFMYPETVAFTEPLQHWIHDLNSYRSNQGVAANKLSFKSLFRNNVMMSDYTGTTTHADYINGNGMTGLIILKPMVCGGSFLKIVGSQVVYGTDCWIVEGLPPDDFSQYPASVYPWLYFPPVISVRDYVKDAKGNILRKDEFYAEPFDDYNGNTLLPVLGVRRNELSSTGWVNVLPKDRVRVLHAGEYVPNPYIMRKGYKANPYEGIAA